MIGCILHVNACGCLELRVRVVGAIGVQLELLEWKLEHGDIGVE